MLHWREPFHLIGIDKTDLIMKRVDLISIFVALGLVISSTGFGRHAQTVGRSQARNLLREDRCHG